MIFVLIVYFLFLLVYAVMSSFILYHLFQYSARKEMARTMAFLYIAVSVIILLITLVFVFRVDWSIGFFKGGI